jgi:hypothetical protein
MPKPMQHGPTMCPDCFIFQGIDTPIEMRPGTTLRCSAGHTWQGNDRISDMELFAQRSDLAKRKRAAVERQNNPNPDIEVEPEAKTTIGAPPGAGKQIVIGQDDQERISKLLGSDFGDGASLFGTILSLTMDMKNIQEELRMARSAAVPGAAASLNPSLQVIAGGDMPVTVIVPERHIEALQAISESNNSTIPDYMNAIIANGFDNNWFT